MSELSEPGIEGIRAAAYRIPTDKPEADGTFAWDATTLVLVEVSAAGKVGIGYTYADAALVPLIARTLSKVLLHRCCFDIPGCWMAVQRAVRNLGRGGMAACALSAVDLALWDLKGRIFDMPLTTLLGRCRDTVRIYGSGGFTTYSDKELQTQLACWVEREGCRFVKMKIGSEPERDPERVRAARSAIGDRALFVDANGAFSVKQALGFIQACEDVDIAWFEEPVTSDDLAGLHLIRELLPEATDVAAGEYIFTLDDAQRLLGAHAVDVLQADITRCGGITGFLKVAALCDTAHIDLSGHCAPSAHCAVACAVPRVRHLEWFHDHVRIEQMLFEGAPQAKDGSIAPNSDRPGHGLEFARQRAQDYCISAEEAS